MDFQVISAIVFLLLLIVLLIINRKKVSMQKILFPLFYILLYRTKFGLRVMDKASKKLRGLIQLFGYISIGLAFVGMFMVTYSIIEAAVRLIIAPAEATAGVALVLPFTNVPGIGYLPFWYWIISIFVLAVIHEFSHGIMARAHNLNVKSSGFAVLGVLVPIIPAAFVEPDEEQLKKQKDFVQYSVLAAGPISNIAAALVILLAISFVFVPIEARMTEPVGFSFDMINDSLPAAQAGMENGTVVKYFNSEPVNSSSVFIEKMNYCVKPGQTVYFGTAENKTYEVVAVANPLDKEKGYVGVNNIKDEVRYKPQYEKYKGLLVWLKELFKWMFLLNFFIGLANLLPIGIVDGGRMLQVALKSLFKNEQTANKIFGLVTALCIGAIAFALIVNYFGNPFG